MQKFLLLLGVSGVGKSTIIRKLLTMDERFVYISPYITRQLREGERDKIHISNETMALMDANGEFLVINELYGVRYGTPINPIKKALEENNFPVLDWPISHLKIMTDAFPNQLHVVYVYPPSWEELEKRIEKDQRNKNTDRMEVACKELELFKDGDYEGLYNFQIESFDSSILDIAKNIYLNYLQNIK